MEELEAAKKPVTAEVELGGHVAFPEVMRCVYAKGRSIPEHCYYLAVSDAHELARERAELDEEKKATGEDDAVIGAAADTKVSLVVRSDSMLVPMSWQERMRPAAEGRLVRVSSLPPEDRKAIAEMDLQSSTGLWAFEPDEQEHASGLLFKTEGGRKLLRFLVGLTVIGAVVVWKLFKFARRLVRGPEPEESSELPAASTTLESAPLVSASQPPASSVSSAPPGRGEPFDVPPDIPLLQEDIGPGSAVYVRRGQKILSAKIESVRPGQCFCDFGSGRRAWVLNEEISTDRQKLEYWV